MPNHPQMPVEEIDLMPHPLDAWRAALNALIAVAPGVTADIAWHLKDAREKTLVCRDFSAASQGEAKLIDRLMLLGAGKLVGNRLDSQQQTYNELGFTHQARSIGIDLSAAGVLARHLARQPSVASPSVHEAQTEHLASSRKASPAQAALGQATPSFPSQQPDKATPDSGHESAPPSATAGSLDRPSGDS